MAFKYSFLDHAGPIAMAHRGGGDVYPENTLAAFQNAVDLGFRYLETDVHLTLDGVVVAFHDAGLDRVTDRTGLIAEQSWAEVSQARVGGTETICRLEQLLDAFPDHRINLDTKSDEVVGPLVDLLVKHRAIDRVCVGSFSDARIAEMARRCGPNLCTSVGPRGLARATLRATGVPIPLGSAGCFQIPLKTRGVPLATPRFVEMAHSAGMAVHVWTINDAPTMNRLLDIGVDGILTDQPAVLRQVMIDRNTWVEFSG